MRNVFLCSLQISLEISSHQYAREEADVSVCAGCEVLVLFRHMRPSLVSGTPVLGTSQDQVLLRHQFKNKSCLCTNSRLRLLFVLATEHTLLCIFLNTWRQILFPGGLHDDAP